MGKSIWPQPHINITCPMQLIAFSPSYTQFPLTNHHPRLHQARPWHFGLWQFHVAIVSKTSLTLQHQHHYCRQSATPTFPNIYAWHHTMSHFCWYHQPCPYHQPCLPLTSPIPGHPSQNRSFVTLIIPPLPNHYDHTTTMPFCILFLWQAVIHLWQILLWWSCVHHVSPLLCLKACLWQHWSKLSPFILYNLLAQTTNIQCYMVQHSQHHQGYCKCGHHPYTLSTWSNIKESTSIPNSSALQVSITTSYGPLLSATHPQYWNSFL